MMQPRLVLGFRKRQKITTTSNDGNSNSKLFEVKSASANGVVINANQDAGATSTTTKDNNTSDSGDKLAENSETTTTIKTANTKDKQCSTVAGEAVDTPIINNYAARRSLSTRSNTPILSREILALQRSVNALKVLTEFVTENAISKDRSLRKVKDDGLNRRDSSLFFSDDSCSDDNGEILPQQAQEEEQYFPNTEHNPQPIRKKRKSIHYKSSPEQKLKQPRQLVSIEQMKKIRYARRSRSQCSIRTYDVLRKDPKNHDFDLNANQGLKMKRPPLESDIGGAKACNSDVEYDKTSALMGVDDDGGSSTITYNHLNASFNDSELVARADGSIEDATDTTTQAELLDRKLQLSWNPPPKEWIMNHNGKSYVCILHEYVQHALRKPPTYEFEELENAATPYSATVSINDLKYGTGYGTSKKRAKSDAARATLEILIPDMKDKITSLKSDKSTPKTNHKDLSVFDDIKIEDPRVAEFCNKTTEPSPHAILLTCLQRNYGLGDVKIDYEINRTTSKKNEFTMTVGKHTAKVLCKNKREGKQLASQAILQILHPHIKTWGSLLRLYGNNSKIEEQEITVVNQPNYAILDKLRFEMNKLADKSTCVQPMGTFVPPSDVDLPTASGSNLNNLDF